jgi:pimeloyl-ACP methyl ester carboxylesterase
MRELFGELDHPCCDAATQPALASPSRKDTRMANEFAEITDGTRRVPLYLLQFDKAGTCTSSQTRAAFFDGVRSRDYTDVYVFAHGWNNGFDASLALFRSFFQGFLAAHSADPTWRPVFLGIQWPSIVIVFPWERGPQLAADNDTEFQSKAIADIGASMSAAAQLRFSDLAARESLIESERDELLQLTAQALGNHGLSDSGESAPDTNTLLTAWRSLQASDRIEDSDDFGFEAEPSAAPRSAGLEVLDPRNLIRVATVYTMKDRAGVIGSQAVRPLIEELSALGAQVRLIGHSYGARVVLAALTTAAPELKVRSALLLQPAVNQYCLAQTGQVPESTLAGGFHSALAKLQVPLYTTFSAKDFPLHETFHLSLRRAKDLGEAAIAGAPPSIYCALGGYGPQGLKTGVVTREIQDAGQYEFPREATVLALDGTRDRINGHGDVANRYTCWALVDQDQQRTSKEH